MGILHVFTMTNIVIGTGGVAVSLLDILQRGNKKRRCIHIFQMRSSRITQTYFTALKINAKLSQCLVNQSSYHIYVWGSGGTGI
jgi:hypothetical protein